MPIKAKFGMVEYATGSLLHAKFSPDVCIGAPNFKMWPNLWFFGDFFATQRQLYVPIKLSHAKFLLEIWHGVAHHMITIVCFILP